MAFLRQSLLVGWVAIVALVAQAAESRAQVVPYKTKGTGFYSPVTNDYGGVGTGTHMGRHSFLGNIEATFTSNTTANFVSTTPQVTIAANGDVLLLDVVGEVVFTPLPDGRWTATWTADFIVVGGTGRFTNAAPADEPLLGVVVNDPFSFTDPVWTFQWTLTGRLR
jgi:hypothetical protein